MHTLIHWHTSVIACKPLTHGGWVRLNCEYSRKGFSCSFFSACTVFTYVNVIQRDSPL